jgi:death-on-curing protein
VNSPAVKWEWLKEADAIGLHDEAIADYGGLPGLRDRGLMQSALARPQSLVADGEPSVSDLAASYCVGIAKNHAFIDGNKRTGYQAAAVFLELNGWLLAPSEVEIVEMLVRVAEGEADERAVALWLSENSTAVR